MTITLSAAAKSGWAKSNRDTDEFLPLHQHMSDSAAVAAHLWDHWLPASTKSTIAQCFPQEESDARIAVVWLAAAHDCGKMSPAFAMQVESLAARMEREGLPMPRTTTRADRRQARHSIISHVALRRWLEDTFGWSRTSADTYAVVPGGHHGVPPSGGDLSFVDAHPELVGEDITWHNARVELLEHCAELSGASKRLEAWRTYPLSQQAQILVTATVILADWIASNTDLFPLSRNATDSQGSRTARAMELLELPGPWRAVTPPAPEMLFRERFDLPDGAEPFPVQLAAAELAGGLRGTGLMVIEAEMGSGKTEAALAATEVLAHRFGAGGVFVALPTMATSDAMYSRVHHWAKALPAEAGSDPLSIYLAHSKSRLNEEFTGLMRGAVGGVGIDESTDADIDAVPTQVVIAHQWLFGRKKGMLADVVIGTIDQILMSALMARHLALRHLALANKVVVIDEVHAADIFMGAYLETALEWLGAYSVPTILLSATLPAADRRRLVGAYTRGRAPRQETTRAKRTSRYDRRTEEVTPDPYRILDGDIGYPVITVLDANGPAVHPVRPSGRSSSAQVDLLADDDDALLQVLRAAAGEGGCVAIIRNTVARAQQTKLLLEQHFPGETTLLHSRFLAVDRHRIESQLRDRFGRNGTDRPHRHFIIGTQVLEQSLDVDFDFMITDLAPLDLILQRMGRLHRHARPPEDRPPQLQRPRCLVTGVDDWAATPIRAVGASRGIYGESALLRAAAVLTEHLRATSGTVDFPCDIAPLVQRAYSSDLNPPPGWEPRWDAAEAAAADRAADQLKRASDFRLSAPARKTGAWPVIGWVDRGVGEADDSGEGRAQVRDSEDGIEVVVVQQSAGQLRVLPWIEEVGGDLVDSGVAIPQRLARALATCTVRLPPRLTSPWRITSVLEALEANGIASWQSSEWLRGELVLVLDENLRASVAGDHLEYDRNLGLLLQTATEGGVE